MKVLIVGRGGREHAIGLGLVQSPSVEQVYALPGSQGMKPQIKVLSDFKIDPDVISQVCQDEGIELIVIGPEDPLVDGLADQLREKGLTVFGPDQKGAQLEGSKIFAKEFMDKYNIPTATYEKVSSVSDVEACVDRFTPPFVLKADGLAAGKGVFICKTRDELTVAAKQIFEDKILGSSGELAILEQFQPGYELSFFILTNGKEFVSLPMAQDHKKLLDNDEGPNTGGMGTVAPMKISENLYQRILTEVVEPTVQGLNSESFIYRGVVFIGLMITEDGPQVLEYNIRFGDPETQVLIPLLDGDWGEVFKQIAQGNIPSVNWQDKAAACVVLAAENYPSQPKKGVNISGDFVAKSDQYFLHAGTRFQDSQWQTNGGRVLNAIGFGEDLKSAIANAYEQASKVTWPGMQLRKDIGSQSQVSE